MTFIDPRLLVRFLDDLCGGLERWSYDVRLLYADAQQSQRLAIAAHETEERNASIAEALFNDDKLAVEQVIQDLTTLQRRCSEQLDNALRTFEAAQQALIRAQTALSHWESELRKAQAWLIRAEQRLDNAIAALHKAESELSNAQSALSSAESSLSSCRSSSDNERGCGSEEAAVSWAESRVHSAQRAVDAAQVEVTAARAEVAAARARVEACTKAVIYSKQAVQLARETCEIAQQGLVEAERSLEYCRYAWNILNEVNSALAEEEQAVIIMRNKIRIAASHLFTAQQQFNLADEHSKLAQLYAHGSISELDVRINALLALNQPTLPL